MINTSRHIELSPDLGGDTKEFLAYCSKVQKTLSATAPDLKSNKLAALSAELHPVGKGKLTTDQLKLRLANSIVLDLLGIGWQLKIKKKNTVLVISPMNNTNAAAEIKTIVRQGHLVERDAQLRQESVREFVKRMETRRLTSKGWHSIFSVMRDGKELAEKLNRVGQESCHKEKAALSERLIQPYLHFIDDEPICSHTGLDLREVWRYFRHTWTNAYKSLPGRSMIILVRDAAVVNHPVIGIAALGSSIVQQKIRDVWIGWDEDNIIREMKEMPSAQYGKWLLKSIDNLMSEIYISDLVREKICNSLDFDYPTDIVVEKLLKEGSKAIDVHREFPNAAAMKVSQDNPSDEIWEKQAQTKLFRSKRCNTIAALLKIRMEFQQRGLKKGTKKELEAVLNRETGRQAIRQLVRMVKAQHVGINMMDIIVCGAIAPYNALLGGKLVSMMMCSPEVIEMYSHKYGDAVSIIASSMKGKRVVRSPKLVFLSTTSLYGTNSSQYNRIKLPCEALGGDKGCSIEFKEIGKSEGYGSYQFSNTTLELMEILLARGQKGRRVNSIFGEGVNPRMRKIRDGLGLIGVSPDELLLHGNPRIVYAVKLANNFREVLMGLSDKPQYLVPLKKASQKTAAIANYWWKRWLCERIKRSDIIAQVSGHTLSYPITHGARVPMSADDGNLSLFT